MVPGAVFGKPNAVIVASLCDVGFFVPGKRGDVLTWTGIGAKRSLLILRLAAAVARHGEIF